ncbi:MAG: hypothetical protein HQL67_10345 [Magnetococcales bacterium]|nr:hypothetical protein [Magnetococcales bacterium]
MPKQSHINKCKLDNSLDSKTLLTTRTASIVVGESTFIFIGSADPGADESDPVWLIQRTTLFADESTATLFANGRIAFDQCWSDRATLSYS